MNTSGRPLLAFTTKYPPMSSINHGGGKRRRWHSRSTVDVFDNS
jgi:hypothetical protein